MLPVTPEEVHAAAAAIAGAVVATPTVAAPLLSELLGASLFLKLENLQHTGSFKDRGALTKLLQLDAAARARGVIAMSAGNHAQGVAHHAQRLGIPATIVMPSHTPFTKVARTEAYGARVVLEGENISDSQIQAERLAQEHGYTLIHPYDDPAIVAGQGTIGLEMLAAVPDLDDLVVPIGGGGLIAGVALAARSINPGIRITGVESAHYPSMTDALAGRAASYGGATLAEGIAVKTPGRLPQRIIGELVDEILLVDEAAIERAVHLLATVQKLVIEGAGAAGIAAILSDPDRFVGRRVGAVLCGGNIDPRMLASILMRGLVRQGQLVRLRVQIEDGPGKLGRLAAVIGAAGGNIVEVHHQRLVVGLPVKRIDVDMVVETRDRPHVDRIIQDLDCAGFPAGIVTDIGL